MQNHFCAAALICLPLCSQCLPHLNVLQVSFEGIEGKTGKEGHLKSQLQNISSQLCKNKASVEEKEKDYLQYVLFVPHEFTAEG